MKRQQQLTEWLHGLFPGAPFSITPASADASFRRYFRVTFDNDVQDDAPASRSEQPGVQGAAQRATTHTLSAGEERASTQRSNPGAQQAVTRIVMDAPPEHENCRPFLHIGKLFEGAGTHVPHVYAQDLEQGFLLLSDLGNTTYLQALKPDNAKSLYGAATEALVKIQLASKEGELPPYDEALLRRELNLFPEWYVGKHLGLALTDKQQAALDTAFRRILDNNLAQPCVYVHRDYHSRNLMFVETVADDFPGAKDIAINPGILDFQDAVYGPITYDLASLFKDAYIQWDEELVMDWLIRYWESARRAGLPVHADFGEFYRDYEWMGVQRHIKVLGIFARLYHRDGKEGYLKDMPLVFEYLYKACTRYVDLKPLQVLLEELHPDAIAEGYSF